MGYPERNAQTLYDAVTPVAVTSSTDVTPIVVTATAHGLVTGDRVLIYGHTTNVAANGIYKVTRLSSSTFSLQDEITGADIAGSGGGAGSGGILVKAPPVMLVSDFKTLDFFFSTSGTATVTLCVVGSLGRQAVGEASGPRYALPNMGATRSPSNPWSFLGLVKLDDGSNVTGSTGVVVAGTDIVEQYEANLNLTAYVTVIPITWSTGAISVKAIGNTAA